MPSRRNSSVSAVDISRTLPGQRLGEAGTFAGVDLDDGSRAQAAGEPPRREVARDLHDLAVAAKPHEIDREAHAECVDRAAAHDVQPPPGGQGGEPCQAARAGPERARREEDAPAREL